MPREYPTLDNDDEIKERLQEMNISLYEPITMQETKIAEAMEEFSSFILHDESSTLRCQSILNNDKDDTVSELQGGNDEFSIYRVSITQDGDDDEEEFTESSTLYAASALLREFHLSRQGQRYRNVLTFEKIRQYMLEMCHRQARERGNDQIYAEIRNFMFILQFGGGTDGQVRHIDNMLPNIQICLYISQDCPSTTVYEMDDTIKIHNGMTLIEYWEEHENRSVPKVVKYILEKMGHISLKNKWYSKSYSFWGTINSHLETFGQLYQPVLYQHRLQTQPGTTLLAGGNDVHAGPPTTGPRMFIFGVGVPEFGDVHDGSVGAGESAGDGEIQYSPVSLHIDLCTLLFCILRHSPDLTNEDEDCQMEARLFLLRILVELVKDDPMKDYLRQFDGDRSPLLCWLEQLLDNLNHKGMIETLVINAATSNEIFYSKEVIKKHSKRKKKRP